MESPHEDAVLNFDLDFLHPTTNNIPIHALKQRFIGQVKNRIMKIDSLLKLNISLKSDLGNKNKELELTKKKLATTTQEYTQTSIEYKELLENYSKCEKDCQSLQNKLKDFQDKYYEAVNNVEAERSHVVQLQQLVKQHEKRFELLQKNEVNKKDKAIKERLERELLLCKKTYKKDIDEWQNKYNILLKELQETKHSKEKLQEQLLAKNDKVNIETVQDFISHDEHSDNEDDISDVICNQDSSQNKPIAAQRCPVTKKDDMRIVMDSDFKNDFVSVDTGCGSSLASSLNSPDFVLSPINGESFEINRGRKLVSTGTSPILFINMTDTGTSPPPAVKMVNVGTSPIKNKNRTNKSIATQTEPVKSNDTPVRPVSAEKDITNIIVSSSVPTSETLPEIDILEDANNKEPTVIQNIPQIKIQETQEKQCLELNNSNNMNEDGTSDHEIEMILNTMRFNHKLITPIPRTPKRSVPEDVRHSVCQEAAIARDQAATAKHDAAKARADAAKTREENKKMMKTVASLMKDMCYIKSFLKNSFTKSDATLELNESALAHDLLQNLTNDDFNYEATNTTSNTPCIKLNKSIINENQTMPACLLDSQVEINLERILGPEPIENSKVTQYENIVLQNTLQENCNDQNIFTEVDNAMCLDNSVEVQSESPTKVPKNRRIKKIKKLTCLGKYRKKCELRKFKIRGKTPPLRKPRMKPKPIIRKPLKKTVGSSDTSITLNDKNVYAKAVMVMAELNAKSSKKSTEPAVKEHHDVLQNDTTLSDIKSPESTKISVKPATMSPEFSASSPKSDALLRSPIVMVTPAVTTLSDTKSPESTMISVKPATLSPKCSASSPKSDTLLRSPIVMITPMVTSSTTDVTILRRSRRSSVLAASCTPTSPIKTPSPSRKLSNMSATLSPISAITSTTPGSKSPKIGIASPSTTSSTPRATRRSLRFSSNSSITSLEVSTPTVPAITPTVPKITLTVPTITPTVPTITTKPMTKPPPSKPGPSVTTRSQVKYGRGCTDQFIVELSKDTDIDKASIEAIARKRKLSNGSDTQCKRVLRSTQRLNSEEQTTQKIVTINQPIASIEVFAQEEEISWNPKESVLCSMIQKYAKKTVGPFTRNVPDAIFKSITNKIEKFMLKIKDSPSGKDNETMQELVQELQKCNYKNFVSGLMKYLTNPDRKMELFGKSSSPPAPQMTRYEAVMLYVIRQLRCHWRPVDIVDVILSSIEHTLFKLNRTPDFDVVESVSHFYALLCRYFGQNSRLKVFMLDSMYCILFKSVPLIKQCLEVHPHIIPLAHMSAAKTSLVTIFVYLLHFYKCDDKFNRVQEIRNILVRRYYYQITEWNETKMLELVGNSIMELKDISNEHKMLRIAIIILGKRHGAKWTQNNIIKKLLQIIEKDKFVPEHVTAFCVSMIGPLMKPYPADMKVHCEIALNKLVNIINTTTSQRIEEAAISSMIIMARHNFQRVNEILLSIKMKAMSPELEETIRDYIRMRPLHIWKRTLPRISMPT